MPLRRKGIDSYQPLKHQILVELPCLYPNCSLLSLNAANSLQPKDQWLLDMKRSVGKALGQPARQLVKSRAAPRMSQVLPAWGEAPSASFHFHLEGLRVDTITWLALKRSGLAAGGDKDSSFSTPQIPLIFDLPTVGQTPQRGTSAMAQGTASSDSPARAITATA